MLLLSSTLDDVRKLSVLGVLDEYVEMVLAAGCGKKKTLVSVFVSRLSSSSLMLAVCGGSEALVLMFDDSMPL